ncbi:MAG: serine hydrolase [Planctomycetaceae bacterium]
MINRLFRPLFPLLCVSSAAVAADRSAQQISTLPKGERRDRRVTAEKSAGGLSAIPDRMRALVAKKQIAGAVTLVASRDRVLHLEAVGQANIEKRTPMRKDTLFAIASMTKPITATAILILRDEGKLSLDDAVSKYIPSFKGAALKTGPAKRQITIRDLLTHTSGLVGSQKNTGTLKQTAETLARRPLGFQPGTKWQYSPGLSVCGRIIEVVSRQSYARFLQKRIFDPLKMTETTFAPTPAQRKRLAALYRPGKDRTSIVPATHWLLDPKENRNPNPSGGLFSTAADLAKFYQMVLNGGERDGKRIVSKAGVKRMTAVQTGDLKTGFTPGNGWGLGWCVVRKPQGVTRMLSPGTFGHGGAFGTQGWVDPKSGRIYVLLIQRTGFGNGDASNVRNAFQELAAPAKQKRSRTTAKIQLKIKVDDGKAPGQKTLERAIRVINARLKQAKIKGATVRATGRQAITVHVVATQDAEIKKIADLVSRPGRLEFALLANRRDHAAIIATAVNVARDVRKGDHVIASWCDVSTDAHGKPVDISKFGVVTRRSPDDKRITQFLVVFERKDRRIDQSGLSHVYSTLDGQKRLAIGFQLKKSAAKKMARLTGENLPAEDEFRRRLAMLIDGRVVLAPSITSKIEAKGLIQGLFSRQDVQNLVATLSVGEPLPVIVSSVKIDKR